MKKNFLADYLGCILFKVLGPLLRMLPVGGSLFLGRRLGDCFYYFDLRHKARVFSNLKRVFGRELSPGEISLLARDFYQSFGESIIEIFLIPMIDAEYISKYVQIENENVVKEALKKGKGAILVAVHAGSWELSNVISANLGFPYSYLVRGQSLPRLNALLNKYRRNKGCRIITREEGLKGLLSSLKSNQAVGITLDQGGKSGTLIEFFGKRASMATGAVKLALRYDMPLIPVFFTRIGGPRIKVWAGKEISLLKGGNEAEEIKNNLARILPLFEDFIRKHPKDYLWTYKIWKYSDQKDVVILSDGKAGHLKQSQALSLMIRDLWAKNSVDVTVKTVEVEFKSGFSKVLFNICSALSGRYGCDKSLKLLERHLTEKSYYELSGLNPDVVVSTGSSLAGVNFIFSDVNLSRSLVAMRPGILGFDKFDLVVTQRHDLAPKKNNVVVIDGALNLVDADSLKADAQRLCVLKGLDGNKSYIGVLIGGDTKGFSIPGSIVEGLIEKIKILSSKFNMGVLFSTSRRTPGWMANLIKEKLGDFPGLDLLVIANENNPSCAAGGIMGLSKVLILSPDSISMVSEAVDSKKKVFVFNVPGLNSKHLRFLNNLSMKKAVNLTDINDIDKRVSLALENNAPFYTLTDRLSVKERLSKIL